MKKQMENGSGKSLINLNMQPAADVVNNLLNKLEKSICWVVSPKGEKKDAELAVEYLIDGIRKNENIPEIAKAALISNARKVIKEYNNQNDIVNKAIEYLEQDACPQNLDDTWLSCFFDKAKQIQSADIKIIFAKILADECKTSGKTSLALIHTLTIMKQRDAAAFQKLAAFCCEFDAFDGDCKRIPFIFYKQKQGYFDQMGLSYTDLIELKTLGLIDFDLGSPYIICYQPRTDLEWEAKFRYGDEVILLRNAQGKIPYGNVMLTERGRELLDVIVPETVDGFGQEIIKKLIRKGIDCVLQTSTDMK